MSDPRLTVVIGANGAGKTTWTRKHRETLPKPFYNADSIAEGLGDANDPALQRAARKLVDERIELDLSEGNTFGFESTYSGRSRPDIVRSAKRLGYTTRAVFLGTETAAINIRRVRKRVEEGGHNVDESEVRRRWTAAWANLLETWWAFDAIQVLDSSGTEPIEVARKTRHEVTTVAPLPQWAQALSETAPKATGRPSTER